MAGYSLLGGDSTRYLFTYRLADNPSVMHVYQQKTTSGTTLYRAIDNVKKMSSAFAGMKYDNSLFVVGSFSGDSDTISKQIEPLDTHILDFSVVFEGKNVNPHFYYLTTDGVLYEDSRFGTIQLGADLGKIKKFWVHPDAYLGSPLGTTPQWFSGLFVLSQNNILFARGTNRNKILGCPTTNDFYEIGSFDIKKLEANTFGTVLLTNDGRLFHTGNAANDIAGLENSQFTHVFPDYRFLDFSLVAQNLVVTKKDDD